MLLDVLYNGNEKQNIYLQGLEIGIIVGASLVGMIVGGLGLLGLIN